LHHVADAVEAATVSPRALAKQLQLGNTSTLERRIRQELEDIGLSFEYKRHNFLVKHSLISNKQFLLSGLLSFKIKWWLWCMFYCFGKVAGICHDVRYWQWGLLCWVVDKNAGSVSQ